MPLLGFGNKKQNILTGSFVTTHKNISRTDKKISNNI